MVGSGEEEEQREIRKIADIGVHTMLSGFLPACLPAQLGGRRASTPSEHRIGKDSVHTSCLHRAGSWIFKIQALIRAQITLAT